MLLHDGQKLQGFSLFDTDDGNNVIKIHNYLSKNNNF